MEVTNISHRITLATGCLAALTFFLSLIIASAGLLFYLSVLLSILCYVFGVRGLIVCKKNLVFVLITLVGLLLASAPIFLVVLPLLGRVFGHGFAELAHKLNL